MIGQTVSHYRIIEKLGGGGMGVVYKAEDTKLHRFVALKFLPEELSRDRHALERFEREAQAASALNHPNICTIHDIDEHEGRHFIAMEYLEGKTLKQRIATKRLEVDEILSVAIETADGLDAAHSRGIIHRDVKPANIFITDRSVAKILDFGLAKLAPARVQGCKPASATATTETAERMLTSPGTAVGTVAYMSPEQALGKDLDVRTDLFSFGAVLYEMATGLLPFRGTTSAATFNAILNSAPTAPVRINPDLPGELERIINKALEKDRNVRYQHASDLRADLKRLKRDMDSGWKAVSEELNRAIEKERPRGKWRWVLSGLALMILAGLGITWLAMRKMPVTLELRQTRLTANPSENPADIGFLSPDGKFLAYTDRTDVLVMVIESRETHPIPLPKGTVSEGARWYLGTWFPDSTKFIATLHEAGWQPSVWVLSALGAPPRKLRDSANPVGPSPDGSQIVYLGGRSGLYQSEIWLMGPQGEEPRMFLKADEDEGFGWPAWAPTSRRIAYVRLRSGKKSIETRDIRGGPATPIVSDPELKIWHSIWWSSDGRLFFTTNDSRPNESGSSLWDIRVDVETGKPRSQPRRIHHWEDGFALVLNATADGKRLAVWRGSLQTDVYVGQLEATGRRLKDLRRLTIDDHNDYATAWTPDGKAVLFHSDRNGQSDIFKQALDRDSAEPIVSGPGDEHDPAVSTDGSWILYLQDIAGGKSRIMRLPVTGGPPQLVLEGQGIEGLGCCRASRNVCVLGERTSDGKQLIFASLDPMQGRGRELARIDLEQPVTSYHWKLSPDGSRIAFAQQGEEERDTRIEVIPLAGGKTIEVLLTGQAWLDSIEWSVDGKGFYVGSTPHTGGGLFFVDMEGRRSDVLRQQRHLFEWEIRGVPSPDGRHLAVSGGVQYSNMWMLENF